MLSIIFSNNVCITQFNLDNKVIVVKEQKISQPWYTHHEHHLQPIPAKLGSKILMKLYLNKINVEQQTQINCRKKFPVQTINQKKKK